MEKFYGTSRHVQPTLYKSFLENNFFGLIYWRKIIVGTILCFVGEAGWAQVIYQHDFGTTTITAKPYSETPLIFNSNLSASVWTTSVIGFAGYFGNGGNPSQCLSLTNSGGNPTMTLTFQVASGYQLSLTQFNFWTQRSGTGAQNWSMSVNGTEVGAGIISTTGTAIGNTNVTNSINGLSGTITVVLSLSAASGTGTFRLDDFILIGTVTSSETFFRSRQNGDWAAPTTWESSPDNLNWNMATKAPTKDVENILIQSAHNIKVSTPVSLDQATIAGILELQTGGVLNINDGVGDDLSISSNGILKIVSVDNYATSVNQLSGANINISTDGKIIIGNGIMSVGNGYENFATSLVNKWNDKAVFEYNNNGIFAIASLTYFPNAASGEIPVFRITKVGGTIPAGLGNNFLLNGLLEINTDITFTGAGGKTFRNGIRGIATLSQTGAGKFYLTASNANLEGASLKIVLSAVMDLGQGTIIPSGANVTISGANISNSSKTLTINGTLDVATINISNPGGMIILNGTYRTAHSGGFSGGGSSIPSTTGNITINPGSAIELYANGNQLLNSRVDFKDLIFSGSGIKTPVGSFNPAGTVTIKDNAIFDCSGRNIGDETEGQLTSTNLTMTGNSRLIVDTYGPNPKMGGNYNLLGGVIEFKGSNLTPQTIRSKNYHAIDITGSNVLMSQGNILLKDGATFTIKNGSVFAINDNTIIGSGNGTETIIVESGAVFKCGNNKGFNGFGITSIPIQSSSINEDIVNIILQPNSTVEYSGTGDQPITNANGLVYQNLILSGSGNKIAPTGNLIIMGNLTKTSAATFIHNNGTAIFNGNSIQSYSSVSPQIVFNNLENKNVLGLNINDSLSVNKSLLLAENSKLNLNADISLRSDKKQTAYLSRLVTNVNINYYSGRFIVERYINTNSENGGHPKSWQLVSTPAFGETIFNTWQEKGNKNISGYGTWITGVSNQDNSFDAISAGHSVKYYDPTTNNWVGIQSTNSNLENEKGYMIFVRGDRMVRTLNASPTPTVLRTRGKLYGANILPQQSMVPAGKFQSVGNPYASAIDFSKISRSNISSSYIAWDPTLGGVYGVGGYQTITAATNYKAIPGNTSVYNTTSDYRNIQSGQAFFVNNNTSLPGSVSFAEDCKLDDANHLVNRVEPSEKQILFANLFSENGIVADGNAVVFDDTFSHRIDDNDALKLKNSGENFGIKKDEKILTVDARNILNAVDTIFYELNNLSRQEYKFIFNAQKFSIDGLEAYLVDQYLNIQEQINLSDSSKIIFSVTDDPASAKANRFFLIFKTIAAAVPLNLFSINAYRQNANVFLEWEIENGSDIDGFQIEHSADAIHFSVIEIASANEYNFVHNRPLKGNNYYRIGRIGIGGRLEYTEIVKVIMPEFKPGINAYPNPLTNQNVNLQFIDQNAGKYRFTLFNSIGQKIILKEINHAGGNGLQSIDLQKNVSKGIYNLEIIKPGGERIVLKIRK